MVAVNAGIFPLPLAARPIDVVLLVQLNVVPAGEPEKVTAAVEVPAQTVWLLTALTVTVGQLITRLYVELVPVQVLASVAVTTIGNVPN